MVNPKILCNQHLLGEHVELHMFVGTINKGITVNGYVENNLLEYKNIHERHTELVNEMERRGMNHQSPLPKVLGSHLPDSVKFSQIDRKMAKDELISRCKDCRERLAEFGE
jgi:hypothetical protein